jgi:hypothetical protein
MEAHLKQDEALNVIDQARQDSRIVAELDTQRIKRYKKGGGYRVRLTLRKQRVLTIDNPDQLPTVLQAWNDL